MKLYFVTSNKGKVLTANTELSGFDIQLEQMQIEAPEPRTYDLEEIAKSKAIFAYQKAGEPLIVSDSGFYLHRWNDFPGPFTNHALQGLGIEGILKLLEGESRDCEFRNVVAYIDQNHRNPRIFENIVKGTASEMPKGQPHERQWSPLYRIFIPEGFEKTLAEMSDNEYGEYMKWRVASHPIFRTFGEWLTKEYGLRKKNHQP